jgi:hypothetical protein
MRLLYLILFCLLTCEFFNSLNAQEVNTLQIDPTKTVDFSDLFESVKVIGLEQTGEALFGFRTPVIRLSGDRLYVSSHSNDREKIFEYDLDGRLQRVIDKFGPGPEEMAKLNSFLILKSGLLSVFSSIQRTIYTFDVAKNKVTRKQRIPTSFIGQYVPDPENDGYFFLEGPTALHSNGESYHWLTRLNSDLNVVESYMPGRHMDQIISYMPYTTHNLQVRGSEVLALKAYSDTIQRISQSALSPAYVLDFGKYKTYNETNLRAKAVNEAFRNREQVSAVNFIDTKERLLLFYLFDSRRFTVFHKADQRLKTVSAARSYERPEGFALWLVHADEEKVVFTYQSNDLRVDDFIKDKMGIEKVENWSALDFDKQEMEETPYLLMFRFK